MPHIFSPRATPTSSCPDAIRASIKFREIFFWMDCRVKPGNPEGRVLEEAGVSVAALS
jgi:hypothetical protein